MGGKALGFEADRMNKSEYFQLQYDIQQRLKYVELIESYISKDSFGDMDLIYPLEAYSHTQILACLNRWFYPFDSKANGTILSVGIPLNNKRVQVDFIGVPNKSFDFAYNYFAYNDMGNLIGRVARRIGLKFGNDGLWYVQRAPENDDIVLKEHLLTVDFDDALEHLGYDVRRYHEGFNTLEDIFEFVMTSRFYDFNKFDLSQRNHKARIRDAKRPNYRAFLEYATKHPKVQDIMDVDGGRTYSFARWTDFQKEWTDTLDKHYRHLEFKKKYNGNIVSGITGLEGKELGQFMSFCKEYLNETCVLAATEETIKISIRWAYMEWLRHTNKGDK